MGAAQLSCTGPLGEAVPIFFPDHTPIERGEAKISVYHALLWACNENMYMQARTWSSEMVVGDCGYKRFRIFFTLKYSVTN